jgi:hypothetical protein
MVAAFDRERSGGLSPFRWPARRRHGFDQRRCGRASAAAVAVDASWRHERLR